MGDINKTEKLLQSLSPKPLPQETKENIIANAHHKKREMQILSPAYRILFALSCFLLILFCINEFFIQKSERNHLAAIINSPQASETVPEEDLQKMTADLLNIECDSNLNQWLIRHYKIHRKPEKLKTHQDILDRLKEEINGI